MLTGNDEVADKKEKEMTWKTGKKENVKMKGNEVIYIFLRL